MERKLVFKYVFLILVGIVVLGSFFIKDNKNKLDELDDGFKNIEIASNDFDESTIEMYIEEEVDITSNNDSQDVKQKEIDDSYEDNYLDDEFNYEKKYVELFGESVVKKVLTDAEKAMEYYVQGEINDKQTKLHFTPTYTKEIEKTINSSEGKKIKNLDVFATEQVTEDEIVVGVIAETETGVEHFNLLFTEEGDSFLIKSIVSMWSH